MKKSKLKKKNTMKKSELKKLIKEEIQNVLNERVDELNVQTDTSEEGNKQITLSVLGGGWKDNQITLSVEEAKELQQLAKTFIGSRKEISKGVNTKDKAFTQSIIGIKPDGLNCIIYRKEGSTYRGYDKPVEASSGYLKAQQSLVYQIAEEKLTEVEQPSPGKLKGATLNLELFKQLVPNINPTNITNTINLVKQNKSLNNAANKILADIMVSMIKTSDDALLTKIFQNLKQMEVK